MVNYYSVYSNRCRNIIVKYIIRLINQQAHFGLRFSFAHLGAVGNIIDSAFYGMIFSESKPHGEIATMFPPGGGYSSFFTVKSWICFIFPLIDTYLPDWFPSGAESAEFFDRSLKSPMRPSV